MSSKQSGVILTYADNLDIVEDCVRIGGYDTLKVVTGWGLPTGWNAETRQRLLQMVPNVIVRTVSGDPSYARPVNPLNEPNRAGAGAAYWDYDFPDPNRIEQEIAEWYAIKPEIMIELGNEPNIFNTDDEFIWRWSFFLAESIKKCREVFPQAKLISPGFMMDPRGKISRFYEIAQQTLAQCDYIGVHFYEYYAFKPDQAPASKGELREAMELHQKFFPTKQWYVTEFGINDSKQVQRTDKGERYARLLFADESWPILPSNVAGAVYYHLGMKGDIHPEYHIYPEGDHSYRNTADAVGAVLGGAAVLGGGMGETFEPSLMASQAARIAELIAELATFESGITANRAVALRNGLFAEPEAELYQASALRAVLEQALACAQGYKEVAPDLA